MAADAAPHIVFDQITTKHSDNYTHAYMHQATNNYCKIKTANVQNV